MFNFGYDGLVHKQREIPRYTVLEVKNEAGDPCSNMLVVHNDFHNFLGLITRREALELSKFAEEAIEIWGRLPAERYPDDDGALKKLNGNGR